MSLSRWGGSAAVLLLALAVGGTGIAQLPPDDHEVLVLQTAREMAARGDWIVPWYNGEPRLNKPPMNYWLTGLVASLGSRGGFAPWHGRVPSLLAGLASAALILGVGRRLYDARTALAGAALYVTSAGFFTYAHDARPDMLYAALSWAGLACFALAMTGRTRGSAIPVYAMWTFYALAILTKGPQVPAMFLVASVVIVTFVQRRGIAGLRHMRPLGGVLLIGALAVPWWWLLGERLPPETVANSQLGGSLLRLDVGKLLNGYYFYRPLQLVLPWLPLVPLAWIAAPGGKDEPGYETSLLLACVLAVTAVAFSFGAQQRYFYLLPALPVMCLLAGRGVTRMLDHGGRRWRVVWWLQALIAAVAIAWLFESHERRAAGVVLACAAAGLGIFAWRTGVRRQTAASLALVVAIAASFATFATSDRFWSEDRRNKHELARAVAAQVSPETPLFALRLTPAVYVWESARRIPRLESESDLAAAVTAGAGDGVYVLARAAGAEALHLRFGAEQRAAMAVGAPDRVVLYRISTAASRHSPVGRPNSEPIK